MNTITKDLSFCGIYMLINKVNGHRYVGSSRNIRIRLWKHRSLLRHNKHENPHLQNAWNKYGEENFDYSILEKCTEEERFKREQFYIDTLKPEYNIALEAIEQPPVTESSRKKHSQTRIKLMAEGIIGVTNNTPVYVYYKDGSFVGYWESIRKAAKALNMHYSSACRCIQGHDFQSKGYRFFKEKQDYVAPFKKPTVEGKQHLSDFIVVNTETGETMNFKGRQAIADYFNVNKLSIAIYIGGKHKLKRKYMIYRKDKLPFK